MCNNCFWLVSSVLPLLELLHTCHLSEFEMRAILILLIYGALVLLSLSAALENFRIQLMKDRLISCCRWCTNAFNTYLSTLNVAWNFTHYFLVLLIWHWNCWIFLEDLGRSITITTRTQIFTGVLFIYWCLPEKGFRYQANGWAGNLYSS